ncbi:hypothetical protein TTHERM_001256561 (macronuclear) [Tetrahymena thermophila SB210]|uniref:Uncharacterized protein n=1 Tax=Tetrahymena thermophila (strain SB210) TaxID=312017 RepID=W7XEG4_TETTS|nr:hypothetical protein TTHERM_001256561 [Tetrahymena thermophila SB210]EWS75033.1 hypothetical protein TTHERM_001256561 [Tetrahymena thermophila SB210]|eukprot:XP_012652432.1 hypothetical protein TTHERM_001256561 [Tetrahymena thermophila SB210]
MFHYKNFSNYLKMEFHRIMQRKYLIKYKEIIFQIQFKIMLKNILTKEKKNYLMFLICLKSNQKKNNIKYGIQNKINQLFLNSIIYFKNQMLFVNSIN